MTDDDELFELKSKTQVKRELLALKDLGKRLIDLPQKDLEKLPLDKDLLSAVIEAKSLRQGALKRQTGFIGRLIADSDHEQIVSALEQLGQGHRAEVAQFHQVEQWRDDLLAGDSTVMTLLHQQFDDFDGQYVRQLVRNAQKEQQQQKPAKSARALFQYLKQCQTEQD